MSQKSKNKRIEIFGVTPLRFILLLVLFALWMLGYAWIYHNGGFEPMLYAFGALVIGGGLLSLLAWKDKGSYGTAALLLVCVLGMLLTFNVNYIFTYLLSFAGFFVLFFVWGAGVKKIHLSLITNCSNANNESFHDFVNLLIHYNFPEGSYEAAQRKVDGQTLSKSLEASNYPKGKAYIDGIMYEYGDPVVLARVRADFFNAVNSFYNDKVLENLKSGAKLKTFWSEYFPLSKEQFAQIVEDVRQEVLKS